MVEGQLQRWWVVVEGILVDISTSSWLVVLHNDGLWWHFTETTFTDFLSLLPKKWLQENQSYLHPVTRTSCLFDLIKGSFKFTENLFHHIGLATVVMCS